MFYPRQIELCVGQRVPCSEVTDVTLDLVMLVVQISTKSKEEKATGDRNKFEQLQVKPHSFITHHHCPVTASISKRQQTWICSRIASCRKRLAILVTMRLIRPRSVAYETLTLEANAAECSQYEFIRHLIKCDEHSQSHAQGHKRSSDILTVSLCSTIIKSNAVLRTRSFFSRLP